MLFLINLDDCDARRTSMRAQLVDLGLSYERIGIDFRQAPRAHIDDWCERCFPGFAFDHGNVSSAEIGCWASHLCAWQALAASQDAVACTVLEDDLALDPALPEAIGMLAARPHSI